MYKCLIKSYGSISAGCQKELGRAVHMAFFVWQPGSILTNDCDEDIEQLCLEDRPNMALRPGAVGSCLASLVRLWGLGSAVSCGGLLLWLRSGEWGWLALRWLLLMRPSPKRSLPLQTHSPHCDSPCTAM